VKGKTKKKTNFTPSLPLKKTKVNVVSRRMITQRKGEYHHDGKWGKRRKQGESKEKKDIFFSSQLSVIRKKIRCFRE